MNFECSLKQHFIALGLVSLAAIQSVVAAGIDPRVKIVDPSTGKAVVRRAGRFGRERVDHKLRGTEEHLGTPAHAINVLNSTITNRIDTRAIVEHAFLVGIDQQLRFNKQTSATVSTRKAGKDNELLVGSLKSTDITASPNNAASTSRSEAAGGGPATRAAGDGQGGSPGYSTKDSDELNQERTHMVGDKVFMGQGTILVSPSSKISVQTQEGEIQLSPLSSAFIVQFGNDVSIFNLGDTQRGDVTVLINKQEKFPVPYGHQMVLSRDHDQFERANPSELVKSKNVHHSGRHHGVHVFDATYGPVSLLDNITQLEPLLGSASEEDQEAAERMMKSVAALIAVTDH